MADHVDRTDARRRKRRFASGIRMHLPNACRLYNTCSLRVAAPFSCGRSEVSGRGSNGQV